MIDGLKQRHRETIIHILAANKRVERVVLFGSRAMQTFSTTSDVDLILFGDHLTPSDQAKLAFEIDETTIPQRVELLLEKSVRDDKLREHVRKYGVEWFRRGGGPKPRDQTRKSQLPSKSSGMADEWSRQQFSDAVQLNPTVRLVRDAVYPFVDIAAVQPGTRLVQASEYRKYSGGGSRFKAGDTLMARITPSLENGKIACYDPPDSDSELPAFGSTEFTVVRARPNFTDTKFVYYLIQWEKVRKYAISQMTGASGRQRVPTNSFDHLIVPIPPLPQQHAIAYILGLFDSKIELNRHMNETLEAIAQSVFKSWFVDFDPIRAKLEGRDTGLPDHIAGLFPDRFIDSESDEIPAGWEVSEIGKEIDVIGPATPSTKEPAYSDGGSLNWATQKDLSNMKSLVLLETTRKTTRLGLENISSKILPAGTVLISSRAPIGHLCIAEEPTAVNQGIIAMVCKKRLNKLYVFFWCREKLECITSMSCGSTLGKISKKGLRPVQILVPSDQILKAYGDVVRPLYNRIVANAIESKLMAQTRDLLLPNLISGGIRVHDLKSATESEV